jgi:hypothetical protein
MPNTFLNLTGRVINGLRIERIARRSPDLCWSTTCERCSTAQVQRHAILMSGTARCSNSGCGRTPERETRRTALTAVDGSRTASVVERKEFELSQQPPELVADPEAERSRAQRIEAERRETEKLREPFRRYYWHQLERGGQPMTLQRFVEIGAYARERIAGIIERDEKGENR